MIILLTNAIQAIKEKDSKEGHIILTTESDEGTVSVHVEDNGGGIPENK